MRNENSSLLRRALIGNGLFSITSGLIAVVLAAQVADLIGVNQIVMLAVGIGVVGFGIAILISARRHPINLVEARLTVVADVSWVIAAAVIIVIPSLLTTEGNLLLGAISVVVGLFAILQTVGIRHADDVHPRRLLTAVEIDVSPEEFVRF
jgi:hypothetical protein